MVAIQNIILFVAASTAVVEGSIVKKIFGRDDLSIRGTNNVFDRRESPLPIFCYL